MAAKTWASGGTWHNGTYDDYDYQYEWTKTWKGQGEPVPSSSASNHVTGVENGSDSGWGSWSIAGGSGSGSGSRVGCSASTKLRQPSRPEDPNGAHRAPTTTGGPGVLPGTGAGAAGGAIWGGVSGLARAAFATDVKDAAIGGAEAGAVGGAVGGAVRAYGAVRGLLPAAGRVPATKHGVQRLLERGLTVAEYNALKTGGRIFTQADGATVYVLEIAPGKFNVIVENAQGEVISLFRHITRMKLERLAENYGWH